MFVWGLSNQNDSCYNTYKGDNIYGEKTNYKLDAVLTLTAGCIEVDL